ncbi:MAG: nucleotidyltransferase family protein [Bacteroidales bacterium]|nr:nucleotidyltransferase family protein [Bacteroidales bacterium]
MPDKLFLQLVQVAVGARSAFEVTPSAGQWDALLQTARDQSVTGVLCHALEVLPDGQLPSRDPIRQWMVERTKAVRRNALVDQRARELTVFFREAGFRSAVLKGQGVARWYPDPALRISGDIDLWVPGGREAVLSYLKGRIPLRRPVYHHVEAKFFDDVEVEVHFLPAFLYHPFRNRRLQAYFAAVAQDWDLSETEGFHYPRPAFAAVFSLVHISKHIINEGVGLRQVMDHHYILQALDEAGIEEVRKRASELGLAPLGGALTYVEERFFGSAGCPELFPPDERRGARLLEDILLSGNFGHADQRTGGLAARFFRFLPDYPSEVLWSPLWKAWHWVWRKCKGYL